MTFEPHPREFFDPANAPTRLSTLREKLELVAADGVELAYVARFDKTLAQLTAEDFVEQILVGCCRVQTLIIGDDFCFGADRKGSLEMLRDCGRRYGFTVEALSSVILNGVRVSSSAVRDALIAPVAIILVAENLGHVKAVGAMTGQNLDPYLGSVCGRWHRNQAYWQQNGCTG